MSLHLSKPSGCSCKLGIRSYTNLLLNRVPHCEHTNGQKDVSGQNCVNTSRSCQAADLPTHDLTNVDSNVPDASKSFCIPNIRVGENV